MVRKYHFDSMKLSRFIALLAAAGVGASPVSLQQRDHTDPVAETTCNGKTYKYLELAAYGFTPSDARDRFGDTLGGIGSSAAFDRKTWKRLENGSYEGIVWTLPDRGWYVHHLPGRGYLGNCRAEGTTPGTPKAP